MTVGLYDSGLSLHGVIGEESRQSILASSGYAQQFLFTVTIMECLVGLSRLCCTTHDEATPAGRSEPAAPNP